MYWELAFIPNEVHRKRQITRTTDETEEESNESDILANRFISGVGMLHAIDNPRCCRRRTETHKDN